MVTAALLLQAAQIAPLVFEALQKVGEMPNVPTPTAGGEVFWKTLAEKNGWKVQQNMTLGNCRILDPANWRVAWGGKAALNVFLEQMPLLADACMKAQKSGKAA